MNIKFNNDRMPIIRYEAPKGKKKEVSSLHRLMFGGLYRTYPHKGRKVPVVQRGNKYYYKYPGMIGVERIGRAKANVAEIAVKEVEKIMMGFRIKYVWR